MKDYTNTSKKNIISALRDKGVDVNDDVEWYELDDEIEKIKEDKSGALIDRTITEISNDSIEKIGDHIFRGCEKLKRAEFSQATSIGAYAFDSCEALIVVDFQVATTINAYAFYSCTALREANFPAALSISDNAFNNCIALTTANFPVVDEIGTKSFTLCKKLKTVNFPVATSIGQQAFKQCIELTTVNFPRVETIWGSAFAQCTELTTADFSMVASIERQVFYNCQKLTALILRKSDSVCTLSGIDAFTSTPIDSKTGYIYVPAALIDSYKTATNWTKYTDQFRAIEDYPDICGGAE